jgi:hypothetical protein
VKQFRESLQNADGTPVTQAQFAPMIGVGLSTLQRYEQLAPPRGMMLVRFAHAAEDLQRTDYAKIFRRALVSELQVGSNNTFFVRYMEAKPGQEPWRGLRAETAKSKTRLRKPGAKIADEVDRYLPFHHVPALLRHVRQQAATFGDPNLSLEAALKAGKAIKAALPELDEAVNELIQRYIAAEKLEVFMEGDKPDERDHNKAPAKKRRS